jgi:hypothetical protein
MNSTALVAQMVVYVELLMMEIFTVKEKAVRRM